MTLIRQQQFHNKGGDSTLTLDTPYPDECPTCHLSIVPKWLVGAMVDEGLVQGCFQCASDACARVFIGSYRWSPPGNVLTLLGCAPTEAQTPLVPELVAAVSKRFAAIYSEAFAAEAHGLTELTGMGLRKALEFLVKDFAIHQKPADEPDIRKKLLGSCIETYIDDAGVKFLAGKSAWIGNDATHYEPRNPTFSLEDLKMLLQLTINAVSNVLLTEQYKKRFEEA